MKALFDPGTTCPCSIISVPKFRELAGKIINLRAIELREYSLIEELWMAPTHFINIRSITLMVRRQNCVRTPAEFQTIGGGQPGK